MTPGEQIRQFHISLVHFLTPNYTDMITFYSKNSAITRVSKVRGQLGSTVTWDQGPNFSSRGNGKDFSEAPATEICVRISR